jgi:hypothetical protein
MMVAVTGVTHLRTDSERGSQYGWPRSHAIQTGLRAAGARIRPAFSGNAAQSAAHHRAHPSTVPVVRAFAAIMAPKAPPQSPCVRWPYRQHESSPPIPARRPLPPGRVKTRVAREGVATPAWRPVPDPARAVRAQALRVATPSPCPLSLSSPVIVSSHRRNSCR